MKTKILILFFGLISFLGSAQTTLTQAQTDTLLSSSIFRQYLTDIITNQAVYFLGQNSFDKTSADSYHYARLIRSNPNLISGDNNLNAYMLIQMAIRGLNKSDNATTGSVQKKVQVYLNTGNPAPKDYIIADYFADKTKNY